MATNGIPDDMASISIDSLAKTVDTRLGPQNLEANLSEPPSTRQMVALVEGSTPHLKGETRELLRYRLRMVSILLFAGFLAFLPRWYFAGDYAVGMNAYVFMAHCVVTLLMGCVAGMLCRKCSMTLLKLRFVELVVFGGPALFFIVMNFARTDLCCNLPDGRAHLPFLIGPWMMLIFTNALFIPNTWQRALMAIGAMAVTPVAIGIYFASTNPGFQQLASRPEYNGFVLEQAILMALVSTIAVVGVHSIGTLRREAFTARQLGQYRLKHLLGKGGMGEVYLAEHQLMKRPCAVKVIRPDKAIDPKAMARFEREVQATAKLSHWNSIDIYDYGRTEDGTFYYAMEYLPGHNIGEMIDEYGPLPASRLVYLMTQVCAALSEAHHVGLIHRDIKPANIFCAYRGGEFDVAKLLDFGLAKPLMEVGSVEITREGAVTGSPLFMSPEQATGEDQVDARSDIYSLGVVMYFAITGRLPFSYTNPVKVMVAHASEAVRPLREIDQEIPEEIEEIVLRCLEKDPDDRFQDVDALRDALCDVRLTDDWTAKMAAEWWQCNGCPDRKKMAAEAVEAAAV